MNATIDITDTSDAELDAMLVKASLNTPAALAALGTCAVDVKAARYECVGRLRGQYYTKLEVYVCGGLARGKYGQPRRDAQLAYIREAVRAVSDLDWSVER